MLKRMRATEKKIISNEPPITFHDCATVCIVRSPQASDCDSMAELACQLGYGCTGDDVRARIVAMRDSNQYIVYVAECSGGKIAGWVGAYVFRSVETNDCAEISGLVVDQSLRSCGIGKLLLAAVERWARRVGCGMVSVRSNVYRDRAHQFYRNYGYEHVKDQRQFQKSL